MVSFASVVILSTCVLVFIFGVVLSPYHILQVSPDASPQQVRASYRRLSLKYHPDKNPIEKKAWANAKFVELANAYEEVLSASLRGEHHKASENVREQWRQKQQQQEQQQQQQHRQENAWEERARYQEYERKKAEDARRAREEKERMEQMAREALLFRLKTLCDDANNPVISVAIGSHGRVAELLAHTKDEIIWISQEISRREKFQRLDKVTSNNPTTLTIEFSGLNDYHPLPISVCITSYSVEDLNNFMDSLAHHVKPFKDEKVIQFRDNIIKFSSSSADFDEGISFSIVRDKMEAAKDALIRCSSWDGNEILAMTHVYLLHIRANPIGNDDSTVMRAPLRLVEKLTTTAKGDLMIVFYGGFEPITLTAERFPIENLRTFFDSLLHVVMSKSTKSPATTTTNSERRSGGEFHDSIHDGTIATATTGQKVQIIKEERPLLDRLFDVAYEMGAFYIIEPISKLFILGITEEYLIKVGPSDPKEICTLKLSTIIGVSNLDELHVLVNVLGDSSLRLSVAVGDFDQKTLGKFFDVLFVAVMAQQTEGDLVGFGGVDSVETRIKKLEKRLEELDRSWAEEKEECDEGRDDEKFEEKEKFGKKDEKFGEKDEKFEEKVEKFEEKDEKFEEKDEKFEEKVEKFGKKVDGDPEEKINEEVTEEKEVNENNSKEDAPDKEEHNHHQHQQSYDIDCSEYKEGIVFSLCTLEQEIRNSAAYLALLQKKRQVLLEKLGATNNNYNIFNIIHHSHNGSQISEVKPDYL